MELGPDHISWADVNGWCQIMGIGLSHWEATTLVLMSKAYDNGVIEYRDSEALSPFVPQEPPEQLMKKIQSILRRPLKE